MNEKNFGWQGLPIYLFNGTNLDYPEPDNLLDIEVGSQQVIMDVRV
ncbi:MAG: hypothetical protein MIO93_07215 [ANME-2 cluster archaeon]|jgi:hypothetical protein|nr:hypothetical protein [ANME-2 cluster archaeon]